MEILVGVLSAFFIAIIAGVMILFGFVLLAWFAAVVLVFTAFVFFRAWYARRYLREAADNSQPPVIEGDYRNISK